MAVIGRQNRDRRLGNVHFAQGSVFERVADFHLGIKALALQRELLLDLDLDPRADCLLSRRHSRKHQKETRNQREENRKEARAETGRGFWGSLVCYSRPNGGSKNHHCRFWICPPLYRFNLRHIHLGMSPSVDSLIFLCLLSALGLLV